MKAYWLRYLTWFASRAPRERMIVAATAVGGILFLGFTYLVEPNLIKARRDARALQEANAAAATMSQQATALTSAPRVDPDVAVRAELASLSAKLDEQAQRFHSVEKSLVAPEQVPALLENLLSHSRGLQLISMKSLPVAPVVVTPVAPPVAAVTAAPGATTALPAPEPATTTTGSLFKHGVEIKVAGSYHDLLTYLTELERTPQRLIWGQLDLNVEKYPRSVMTLTVYTLSLDTSWLVI